MIDTVLCATGFLHVFVVYFYVVTIRQKHSAGQLILRSTVEMIIVIMTLFIPTEPDTRSENTQGCTCQKLSLNNKVNTAEDFSAPFSQTELRIGWN